MPTTLTRGVISRSPAVLAAEIAVVGSGPGGAITACLLAEAGRDVVLIEEGPHVSVDACVPFSLDEMLLKYRNGGLTAALGTVKVQYVEGRCVGGGSEINSGLYHRTPPEILEEWARDFQVEAIGERDLTPHFEACERDLSVGLQPAEPSAASRKLSEGAQRLRWKSMEVPRWFKYDAQGRSGSGRRQSMTETYVPRALGAGCRLVSGTRVRSLRREGGSARWVLHAESAGERQPVRVEAETVFVCGGAIQTPALLRRSGIKKNVGNSLRLHPMIKFIACFPDEVNALDMGVPAHQVKEFSPQLTFGASISSPPHLAIGLRDHPDAHSLNDWRRMAVYYASTLGNGCGSIRCVPGCRDPLVRYRMTNDDMQRLSDALQRLAMLLLEAGATALYPSISESRPITSVGDLSRLAAGLDPGRTNLMTVHLFSSCPMGEDRKRCATNSFGKVHGFENLYVSDASLLCSSPTVNPQGSIMALARRNALRFLEG